MNILRRTKADSAEEEPQGNNHGAFLNMTKYQMKNMIKTERIADML